MIHTNRIVTVGEQESIIDRPIVLYRGDREVEIEFTLVGNEFTFSEEGNVIKSVNASHGQLVLNTPSGEHMFSELAECHEGKVVFVVTKEMIDEFIEMGFYSFQIRLYDSAEMKSRVTIPPVMNGFDIRNPIAAEDETNVVDQGIVDYARIFKDQSNEELPTFTWDGEYVKTEWAHHDVITENKMNKIEDALYSINANIKESDVVMLNTLDQVKKDADKYVKEHMAEVEAEVDEFERNLNTDVQQFKIDTNAAMTAHKNEVSEELDSVNSQLESVNSQLESVNSQLADIVIFNTNDIQNDIDDFNNEGKLHIKEGVYILENQLNLKNNMVLSGKFNKTVLKISENASTTTSLMYGEGLENIVVENIVFDGFGTSRDSDLYYHGGVADSNENMKIVDVELKNCKNITIKNCIFKEAIYGSIRLTNCENVNFENNIILSSYGHGLIVDKSYNCFISNNRIFNCGKDSKYPSGLNGCGICFIDQTPLNETSHTNIVTNNIVGNCREAGISYEGHRRIISNNIIFNSGKEKSAIKSMSHTISNISNHNDFRRKQHLITGNMIIGSMSSEKGVNISIHATGSDVQISNNFIYNRSNEDYILAKESNVVDSHSIYVQAIHDGGTVKDGDTRNIFIDNNYIKNCCGRGIFVTGGYGTTTNLVEVKNNKVINCVKSGIVTSLTNGVHIEGNLIQNCAVQKKDDEKPIYINTEKRRLILNDNKVIFDDLEIPFENELRNATDGNIELNYCTMQNCQINRNVIIDNHSNAIKIINSTVHDLQLCENMIKPHSEADVNCSGIIIHTGSYITRLNCSNNNIIQCKNRCIYLRNITSGVVNGNITDESSKLVYMHSNVTKCSINGNVGGQIGMAGNSNNTNNLITNNIVTDFAFIDTSNNKIVNNNIDYQQS